MTADFFFIRQHFDPGEAIRVRPDRVEHTCEIYIQGSAVVLQQVGQDFAHFIMRQGVFLWPV